MTKLLLTSFLSIFSVAVFAQTPPTGGACEAKHQAKHQAHEALHACLESWMKDEKPSAPSPSEDCSNKLVVFIAAAKDAKACHIAQHGAKTTN